MILHFRRLTGEQILEKLAERSFAVDLARSFLHRGHHRDGALHFAAESCGQSARNCRSAFFSFGHAAMSKSGRFARATIVQFSKGKSARKAAGQVSDFGGVQVPAD